jgi:hypothetical protein
MGESRREEKKCPAARLRSRAVIQADLLDYCPMTILPEPMTDLEILPVTFFT